MNTTRESHRHTDLVVSDTGWSLFYTFDTEAEQDAFLALFPKSVKARRSTYTVFSDGSGNRLPESLFFKTVVAEGHFKANGVNGGVNETGLKRLATVRRVLAANGYDS